jgi:hypothetical protein
MGLLIGFAVFALVVGMGYAVRERNRMRSRRYYHDDWKAALSDHQISSIRGQAGWGAADCCEYRQAARDFCASRKVGVRAKRKGRTSGLSFWGLEWPHILTKDHYRSDQSILMLWKHAKV